MVDMLDDPRRTEPPFTLAERPMLDGWLEFHRVTLLLKCEGLDDAQRKARPVATSILSLHGLVRHMAEVERGWFQGCLLRQADLEDIWDHTGNADAEIYPIDAAEWETDLAIWQRECAASRDAVTGKSLDDTGEKRGNAVSLRWIYTHMIEEYARHNGHADLIRELIDGSVGD